MDEKTITLLRGARIALQTLFEPIDLLSRLVNNKRNYPPLRLRQKVGNLDDFEGSGGEYLAYLKLLCGLKSKDRVLDIGCGCGLMTLNTSASGSLLDCKEYMGLDIDKKAIDWCERHIRGKGNLDAYFSHLKGEAIDYLPCASHSFEVVLLKSIFTHLYPSEARNYLEEINRILVKGGKCLSTWFILDGRDIEGRFTFGYRRGSSAYERATKPRLAVAYSLEWIEKVIRDIGFNYEIYQGTWTNNGSGLSFQDIIVLEKK